MKPTLSGNPTSFLVTAAQVLFDGVDIGFVSGVKGKVKAETTEVKTDQLGKTTVNDYDVGTTITVEMMMDQISAFQLKQAYTFGTLIGSGASQRISWGNPIGGDYYSLAKTLVIRPTVDDTSDTTRNFQFFKAAPIGDSEISFTPDKKAQIKVTFKCYPDLTQPNGQWFGSFGDQTAGTLTPSSVGTVVPGEGNVGNGTVGSSSTSDAFTKTENWVATCIALLTSPNRAVFSVVGSVTGARGNATTGTAFHSNSTSPSNSEINFTISEGGTIFAIGDTFTIPTVAANYT